MWLLFGFFLFVGALAATHVQQPLSLPEGEADEYQFRWPIQRVAVIGAGPSGLIAFRELTEAGLDVRIFERESVPGGIWHYTEEVPLDAPVPNAPAPIGDFVPSLPPANVDLPYSEEFEDDGLVWRAHRGPKPIWESLTSNVPSPLLQYPDWPWPVGTPWKITHYQVRNYLRSYASYLHINSNDDNPVASYNTRVERVEKRINQDGEEQGWRLWLKSLEPTPHNTFRATWWTEDFDAVVIATGLFNTPSIPSIRGLGEWYQRFPTHIHHSRQYRRPEAFANQTVLIIGASFSGSDIARDLNYEARDVYVSSRPHNGTNGSRSLYQLIDPITRMPKNTTLVGEINQFLPLSEGSPIQSGQIELKNGTIISGFDSVIFATGFRYSYPFLPQYYDGATYTPHSGSAKSVSPFLPLDGTHVRDLYRDLFYIYDPTLAFPHANQGAVVLQLSVGYTSLALAKVWTNTAKLPSMQTMLAIHRQTIEARGGYGKQVLFLSFDEFIDKARFLIGWLNTAAAKYGGKQVDGLPKGMMDILRFWVSFYFGEPQPSLGFGSQQWLD